jgi:hypothetical protein
MYRHHLKVLIESSIMLMSIQPQKRVRIRIRDKVMVQRVLAVEHLVTVVSKEAKVKVMGKVLKVKDNKVKVGNKVKMVRVKVVKDSKVHKVDNKANKDRVVPKVGVVLKTEMDKTKNKVLMDKDNKVIKVRVKDKEVVGKDAKVKVVKDATAQMMTMKAQVR